VRTEYLPDRRVWCTSLRMIDGRSVHVLHAPHPCQSAKFVSLMLAIRAAHMSMAVTDDLIASLEEAASEQDTRRLQSIRPVPSQRWVAIQVSGDGRFALADGNLIHNCTIGYQSKLLQPHMRILQISASEIKDNIESMLKENLRIVMATPPTDEARAGAELARLRLGGDPLTPLPDPSPSATPAPLLGYALAIDGSSLEVCLRHFRADFIALFLHTATIISYRSTPRQKALAVQVVKEELGKTTLAIGDGANVS
jgi:hypothetical protein